LLGSITLYVQGPKAGIQVTPAIIHMTRGQTQAFSASVVNLANPGVAWSIFESALGYDAGTISSNGIYTAPGTPGTYHVVATSLQDHVTCARSTVVVDAMRISPNPGSTTLGGTIQFGADCPVEWSVQDGGTINGNGLYQAPSTAGTHHVVATSTADSTVSVVVSVSVTSVIVKPAKAHVSIGKSQAFKATMNGASNPSIIWSVQEGASGGDVTEAGVYTAPTEPGTYHVVATSPTDANNFATATVTVDAITVTPNPATCGPGTAVQFRADQAVWWSIQEGADGGSISASGIYQAPQPEGVFHVIATAQADSTIQIVVPVTVKVASRLTWTGDRVYSEGQLICEDLIRPDGTTATIYEQGDQVGSPNWVTDSFGNQVGQSKNLPFGERLSDFYPNGLEWHPFVRFAGHENGEGYQIYT
jgi:hypothetical protein